MRFCFGGVEGCLRWCGFPFFSVPFFGDMLLNLEDDVSVCCLETWVIGSVVAHRQDSPAWNIQE